MQESSNSKYLNKKINAMGTKNRFFIITKQSNNLHTITNIQGVTELGERMLKINTEPKNELKFPLTTFCQTNSF